MSYFNGLGLPEEMLLRRNAGLGDLPSDNGEEALEQYAADARAVVARKNRVIRELREALMNQANHAARALELLRDMRQQRDAAIRVAEDLRDEHAASVPGDELRQRFEKHLDKIKRSEPLPKS